MAAITLWMGIGSTFFTTRTAASAQEVLEQMKRPDAQEAIIVRPAPGSPRSSGRVTPPVSVPAAASVRQISLERAETR